MKIWDILLNVAQTVVFGFVVLAVFSSAPVCAAIVDSVNQNATLGTGSAFISVPSGAGWYFTPSSSYFTSGVDFKFSTADGRTVTEEIFDTNPPTLGGTLLRSATFVPAAGVFAGGAFAPISFTSGHTYFIGLLGIDGLGGPFSSDTSAVHLAIAVDTGSGLFPFPCSCPVSGRVIMQFEGAASSVPEPASGVLALAGLGLISLLRKRRASA